MKTLYTKTIILNLLEKDKKPYLAVKRLQKLLIFIYEELAKQDIANEYEIAYDISRGAIERVVIYNSQTFDIDEDDDVIYLRKNNNISNLIQEYKLDDKINSIIDKFVQENTYD